MNRKPLILIADRKLTLLKREEIPVWRRLSMTHFRYKCDAFTAEYSAANTPSCEQAECRYAIS
jgi:hypothetical protein